MQFLVSNYHGPWLVDIAGAIVSMLALVVLLKFWQPATIWRYEHEREDAAETAPAQTRGSVVRAWMPWVLMSVFVFAWGTPQVKDALNGGTKEKPNFLSGITKFEVPVPRCTRP